MMAVEAAHVGLVLLLLAAFFDAEIGQEVEEIIDIAIAVFASVLFILTLSAYRQTHLRRLRIVSVAFALFAVEVGIAQLDNFVFVVGYQVDRITVAAIEFAILFLFFLAVVAKD
jgi:hypothetical protein